MSLLYFRNLDEISDEPVSDGHPLPVQVIGSQPQLVASNQVLVPYGATAAAIDANDALGDMVTFFGIPRYGRIVSIKMVDQDDDTLAATIHIFTEPFTAAASDAAFTISVADSRYWVASEAFDAGTDIGAAKVHVVKNVNADYYAPEGKLYAQLSSTGTPNIASAATMPLLQLFILPLE